MKNKTLLITLLILLVIVLISISIFFNLHKNNLQINSFKECEEAGFEVMESHPRKCMYKDKFFVEEIMSESKEITVIGKFICLPHKEVKDFMTLECAWGFGAEDGNNYFISTDYDQDLFEYNDKKLQIEGIVTYGNDSIYNVIGTIKAHKITIL